MDDLLLFGNYVINLDQHLISLEPILPSNTDGPISQLFAWPGMRNAYYTDDVYASGIYQQKRMNQILAFVAKYPLNAPIQEVCSLKDRAKAHYLIQSGTVFGKIILIN